MRAAFSSCSAGTPVISLTASGVYLATIVLQLLEPLRALTR